MKNWQGIPTTRLTLGGEVMVPRDNRTLVFSTELLSYIISFATQGKIRQTVDLVVSCLQCRQTFAVKFKNASQGHW